MKESILVAVAVLMLGFVLWAVEMHPEVMLTVVSLVVVVVATIMTVKVFLKEIK